MVNKKLSWVGVNKCSCLSPSEIEQNSSKPKKAASINELLDNCPQNEIIGDNLVKAWSKINSDKYNKIVCTVSGGADSDVMLDVAYRCDKNNKVDYVWFDTGLEYQATKDHLRYLEEKYDIEIKKYKAVKPIPTSCKEFGQPFLSKKVSEYIERLQKHNFQWEDESFDVLYKRYPKCKSALEWWCNMRQCISFNIDYNRWLKEFIISNPPTFKVSNKCCNYAKKKVAHNFIKDGNYDMNMLGVRRAEGGVRSYAYKSCFDDNGNKCDNYRPLFWYTNSDKEEYEIHYDILHSDCYTIYGLTRTGCSGCPFGRDFEEELKVIEKYEPKLFVAVNNIFGDSYEYTRKYREFVKKKKKEEKLKK